MEFETMTRLVFAGDSVTDMGSSQPVGEGLKDRLGFGYVRMVENLLAACYPERLIRVTNSGVSGNTSRDLLARWERDVLALKPDYLSICIGINDVWRQFDSPAITSSQVMPEEYEENLRKMLDSLRGKVKGVFLLTPYYMEPCREDWMRARMEDYVAVCHRLAAEYGAILVDLQATFDEYFKYRHSSFVAWDRIHPNQIGATIIAREFLKHCDFDYDHIPQKER